MNTTLHASDDIRWYNFMLARVTRQELGDI